MPAEQRRFFFGAVLLSSLSGRIARAESDKGSSARPGVLYGARWRPVQCMITARFASSLERIVAALIAPALGGASAAFVSNTVS